MIINIKGTNLELTPSIKEYIEVKINSLDRFLKGFKHQPSETTKNKLKIKNPKSEIETFVEIARTTKHHYKGDVFYAEINLELPEKKFRAEHQDLDIRIAIDKARDKIKNELTKYKDLKNEEKRRGK